MGTLVVKTSKYSSSIMKFKLQVLQLKFSKYALKIKSPR